MVLVEGTSPWVGSSYQRLYIWAEDLAQAMELAKVKISEGFDAAPFEKWKFEELLTSSTPAFATEVSTEGWDTKS